MKTYLIILIFTCITGLVSGAIPDFQNDSVNVVTYGANGVDLIDDTDAFNAAIAYCKTHGYKTMFVPCGTYFISSPLTKLNNAFKMISIVGENTFSTILDLSRLSSGQPCLRTSGGSGQLSNAVISSLTFRGENKECGIELVGSCGVKIRDCNFNDLEYGIVFSNDISPGTFTEYCIAEDCAFKSKTAVFYKRGKGDASFHGSGLKGCTVETRKVYSTPVIKIGEDTKPVIALYNAPMDFQVWVYGDHDIILGNTSPYSGIITHGMITVEIFNGHPTIANSACPVYHHGQISSWGSDLSFGEIQLLDWSATNPDGSINLSRRPYSVSEFLDAETVTIDKSGSNMLGAIVTLMLSASEYDYRYRLFIAHNGYGEDGIVKVLDIIRSYDHAGLGAPEFTVNSKGQLMVTNPAYASTPVTAQLQVSPMGQRKPFFIGD